MGILNISNYTKSMVKVLGKNIKMIKKEKEKKTNEFAWNQDFRVFSKKEEKDNKIDKEKKWSINF